MSERATKRTIVGAMSGTSADGVDAALIALSGHGTDLSARMLKHLHRPYPSELRRRIFAARGAGAIELAHLAGLARDISLLYADAVHDVLAAANFSGRDVVAVAAHGQTLYHAPPNTIQWLDPALLAARTKIAVVSDFRRADCAAGGQGASPCSVRGLSPVSPSHSFPRAAEYRRNCQSDLSAGRRRHRRFDRVRHGSGKLYQRLFLSYSRSIGSRF